MQVSESHSEDEEEITSCYRFFLPRCLSYAEESFVDNYSVSGDFVHNPRVERNSANSMRYRNLFGRNMSTYLKKSNSVEDERPASVGCERQTSLTESEEILNASDLVSEEGIYVNMTDDLDSLEGPNGRSYCSDDFAIDSINSPDENDLGKTCEGRGSCLEEAVTAAMTKVAIKSNEAHERAGTSADLKLEVNETEKAETIKKNVADFGSQRSILDYVSSDSPVYEDREFNFSKAELRKSSSLKATKTPPGTPSRKKAVRFADAMGLDLESVRHVMNQDAPPKIPASAMADLKVGVEEDRKFIGSRYLTSSFTQPGSCKDFFKHVLLEKVSLENAIITDLTITGVVRVANIGFHKCVRIRYTTNDWHTFHDIMGAYIPGSCDGNTDRFSFSISAPAAMIAGSRLQFAISYTVNDVTYWDSNNKGNYTFECFAKTTPTEAENAWLSFL